MGYHVSVIGLRIVFGQVAASLRHRAARHAMTSFGVLLGSAFYSAVSSYRHSILLSNGQADAASQLQWFSYVGLTMMLAGLTNSMLIAVSEGIREIGTLKCLGASDATVLGITLGECAIVALTGCMVGVPVGLWAGARLAGESPLWPTMLPLLLTSFGVCLAASLIPAFAASRIPAAAALRSEV